MPRNQLAGPRPRKALGQHFLRDSGVLLDIVRAVRVPAGGFVLEIGAGTGQLTEALLDAGHEVVALEIEERLLRHLATRFEGRENLTLRQADARLMDVREVVPRGRPFVAVGNLPYFAANPIIRHLLESDRQPVEAVLMVQREVGREIAAKPGHASLLTLSVDLYAEAELLFDVSPLAFDPPPAVYSSVVRLVIRREPLVPRARIDAFFTFVSKTFRNPRKQIHNALTRETGLTADQAEDALGSAHVDPMRRAETLSISEWTVLLDASELVAPVREPLVVAAPAKINLVLEVTGRRDDGYHEIDTIMQTLECADRVMVREGGDLVVTGRYAAGTPTDDTNLVWKAASTLRSSIGASFESLHIELEKNLPAAGGVGGGSSDAAAALKLLRQWWPQATDGDIQRAAEATGSDVPFFLHGGTCRAQGRGERITELPPLTKHGVVLFVPPETIQSKTARMFAALDQLPFDDGRVTARFAESTPSHFSSADVHNSFEKVAFDLFPNLAKLWEMLEARIGEPVRLAGAGPTLFWIGPLERVDAIAEAAGGLRCNVIPTATANP